MEGAIADILERIAALSKTASQRGDGKYQLGLINRNDVEPIYRYTTLSNSAAMELFTNIAFLFKKLEMRP